MNSNYRISESRPKPKIRAILRPAGKMPFTSTSSSNVSKSTSCRTKDSNLSEGTTSNGGSSITTQQSKGNTNQINGDEKSVEIRHPLNTTRESVRSVDSQRSLTTVCSIDTSRIKKSDLLNMTRFQLKPPKKNSESSKIVATRRGPIIRTFQKPDRREIVFPSLQRVRNVNSRLEFTMYPGMTPRTGLQLYKTSGYDLEPFKITKFTFTKSEEPESTCSDSSEIVSGCRIITTRPDDYTSTIKAIHPSNKMYQTIPEMDPKAKEELLADFAKAGIDLENLGENIADIGIKMSHDPIMHRFKEIPVFRRRKEPISMLMTSNFI